MAHNGKKTKKKEQFWEGTYSFVLVEKEWPYIVGAEKYYTWYLKRGDRLLFSWKLNDMNKKKEYEEFKNEYEMWKENEKVWNLIKEDIGRFEKKYYKEFIEVQKPAKREHEKPPAKVEKIKPPRWRIVRIDRIPPEEEPLHCTGCGKPIRWVYWVLDTEKSMNEKDAKPYGSTCVRIVTGKSPSEIFSDWEIYEARLHEEWERLKSLEEAKEWRVANKKIIEKLEELAEGEKHYLPLATDFLDKIAEYGTLTKKQMDFVKSLIAKSDNLVPFTDYFYLGDLITLATKLKLSRMDANFIDNLIKYSPDYGITYKQKKALLNMIKRYKNQIRDLWNKLDEFWRKKFHEAFLYFKLKELL